MVQGNILLPAELRGQEPHFFRAKNIHGWGLAVCVESEFSFHSNQDRLVYSRKKNVTVGGSALHRRPREPTYMCTQAHAHMRAHPGFSSIIVEVERHLPLREQVLDNTLTYVLFYKNGDIGAQKKGT